jgi:hypothetical protein
MEVPTFTNTQKLAKDVLEGSKEADYAELQQPTVEVCLIPRVLQFTVIMIICVGILSLFVSYFINEDNERHI